MLLKLRFTKPQRSHTLNFMEGLLMCEATKTLSAINRLLLESTHPSSIADFFTYSPWDNEEVRRQAQGIIIEWVVGGRQGHLFRPRIIISIDDSLCNKPKESKHFKPVDWHFDTKEGKAYGYGVSFISMHIECGNRSLPINWRIYLREKTIRKLNRIYRQKISFRSKVTLSIEMLKEIQSLLPEGYPVHILFDSWYASKKLIQFCLKNKWHIICALKSNRIFEGKRLSKMAHYLRSKNLTKVWVDSANNSTPYWTCLKQGRLKGLLKEVSVIISKRHPRDKRPEFFLCTDTSLSAKEALSLYVRRWAIEIDYLYLKSRLGLGDFRVRSMEGINRYFTLVFLTLAYLSWRKAEEGAKNISEVIALHRQEQYEEVLRAFGRKVIEEQSIELALKTFLPKAA
ncbi:MAG: transposase [Candidatus Edwardsbacteria bacterium]